MFAMAGVPAQAQWNLYGDGGSFFVPIITEPSHKGGPPQYLVSLTLNVWLFSRLRGGSTGGGAGMAVRGAIASALSQAIDSVVFITLAFYGEFPIGDLLIGQILAKVVLSVVLVPVLITLGVALARALDGKTGTAAPTLH